MLGGGGGHTVGGGAACDVFLCALEVRVLLCALLCVYLDVSLQEHRDMLKHIT